MGSCCVDLLDVQCSGYEEQVLMHVLMYQELLPFKHFGLISSQSYFVIKVMHVL